MINIDRKNLVIMMEAGYVYLGMLKYKEAGDVFKGVSVLAPESEIPLVALGGVDFCVGKFTSAIKWYKKALKMDPTSFFAKVYLAEALFFSGKKKEAIKIFKEIEKEDKLGGAGEFARTFLDAINKGFEPDVLKGFNKVKNYEKE